jgi:integrase
MKPDSLAYDNFANTCKSPATRRVYIFALTNFMDYLKIPHSEYNKLLDKDSKIIQMDIINYIGYLKGKSLSYAVIALYVAALSKFYIMNDILTLNWKKIKSNIGEHDKIVEDRPYIHSEIHTLIHDASPRNKALILLLSSSGVRIGAIPLLRIRDLKPIDELKIYRINVYSKSKKSNYFTFCTPECRNEIDAYIDYRKRSGEQITEDSPLFRAEFNNQDYTKITKVSTLSVYSVQNIMKRLLYRTGIIKQGLENSKRNDIMRCHGFRKFYETNAFKAGMDNIYIRRLLGQKSGLEDSYLKLSEEELLLGDSKHVGYVDIIDQLTINEENRLKRKVQEYKVKADKVDEALQEIAQLKKNLGL